MDFASVAIAWSEESAGAAVWWWRAGSLVKWFYDQIACILGSKRLCGAYYTYYMYYTCYTYYTYYFWWAPVRS